MSLVSKIAHLDNRLAGGGDPDALVKKHFNDYLIKHPASKMNFEKFKESYGAGLTGQVKDKKDKIIGFTSNADKKTGELKPIYNHPEHPAHKNFNAADNFDAMKAHHDKALEAEKHKAFGFMHNPEVEYHQQQAVQHGLKRVRPRPVSASIEELEKRIADIGSRGGKIIGKTKSGKPIYDSGDHASHKDFTAGEHKDAMNLHKGQIHKLQNHPLKALHKDLIDHHTKQYLRHSQQHKNITNPEPEIYDFSKHF